MPDLGCAPPTGLHDERRSLRCPVKAKSMLHNLERGTSRGVIRSQLRGKVTQTRGIELEARGLVLCHLGGETCAVEIVANALQGDVHVQSITNERLCGVTMDLDVGLVPVQYEPNEEPNGVLRQGLRPARSL